MTSLNIADFKGRFSEVLAGVLERHERVVVQRRGKPVAVLVPVEDAATLAPEGPARPRGVLAAAGAWAELSDPDAFVADVYGARDAALDREPEPLE